MAEEGLEFEYHKKFQGIEFLDMHDLTDKVGKYESLLKEEMQKKTTTKETYYKNLVMKYAEMGDRNAVNEAEIEISVAEVNIDKLFTCKELIRADNSNWLGA